MSIQPSNRNQFVWKIPKFSSKTQKSNTVLTSQVFHTTNLYETEWEVTLSTSNPEENNAISIYLKRCDSDSDSAPEDLFLQLEVCFLDATLKEHKNMHMSANFKKDCQRGFTNCIERRKIIQARKLLLPKDRLTVQCCLWKCGSEIKLPQIRNVSTSIILEQTRFPWCLGGFRHWEQMSEKRKLVWSDELSNCVYVFAVLLPEGRGAVEFGEVIRFSIHLKAKPSKQISMFAKVSVLDNDMKPRIVLESSNCFGPQCNTQWHLGDIAKRDLTDERANILDDEDMLYMACELTVADGEQAIRTRECLVPFMNILRTDSTSLLKEIKPIYESADFSDIRIKVGDEYFPAHKLVLGARSQVFREALRKAENRNLQSLHESTLSLPRGQISESETSAAGMNLNQKKSDNLFPNLQVKGFKSNSDNASRRTREKSTCFSSIEDSEIVSNHNRKSEKLINSNTEMMPIETNSPSTVQSLASGTDSTNIANEQKVLQGINDITIRVIDNMYIAEINSMSRSTLQHMLNCMYTDTIEGLDLASAFLLFQAGTKFQFQLLVEKCETFLKSCINMESIFDMLTIGDYIPIKSLKDEALNFIVRNSESVLASGEWLDFVTNHKRLALKVLDLIKSKRSNGVSAPCQ